MAVPSRVLSPLDGHLIAYGKLVMNKYIKVENTLKRYLCADFLVFNPYLPYFPKRLIINKEELIIDKEEEIISLR